MAPELSVLLAAVALPFLAAAITPLAARLLGERMAWVAAATALASFLLLASQYGRDGAVELEWIPSLDVTLRLYVDGWALLFALLASGVGVLVFAYSRSYMHDEPNLAKYYAALLTFMGSILGVALAADLVSLFTFWELTSLSSFVLIGHYTDDAESIYAARMAMFVTVGGGLFLLVGFLFLAFAAGTTLGGSAFDLTAMLADPGPVRAQLRENDLFVPALLFIAIGAGSKSAQVPLHFWLPNAMAAPTPVSAFLHSATMVKAGVYLLGRLRPLLASPEWTYLFATVGLVTMAVCALLAVASTDIKELLAYSTASHLGLMVAGFGLAPTVGADAGVFHLFNHALFKAALFLVAGIVAHEAGTRRLADLGGLGRDMPITAAVTGIVALSMAGIPPFSGFYSKELLFEAAHDSVGTLGVAGFPVGWLYVALAVFASIFTVLYSLRFLGLFLGDQPEELRGSIHRAPALLLVPPGILAVLTAVVSVAPGIAVDAIVQSAADATAVTPHEMHYGLPTSYSPAVGMSAVAIGLGLVAYPAYGRIHDAVRTASAATTVVKPGQWYDGILVGLVRTSWFVDRHLQNGRLRNYATWTFGVTCALALAGYLVAGAAVSLPAGLVPTPDGSLAISLVLAVAIVAALAVVRAPTHPVGVLTLSILGFMVAIVYILASAPDLALTQLVVETLILVIFLLVIEEIPDREQLDARTRGRDVALSFVVGLTVFLTVVLATDARPEGRTDVAEFYAEEAVPGGGGTNVVNVILTDFRGFDTMGEIVVVAIAAISIITLFVMRTRGESP
ncbi:hydrogen gas-evolving membrane-bound hydrogenase subunit E [Halovivax limisalsi]|uniref:hydrogen gas-evolving membrane-bound hydrogenase subunit E n=1 Tax=Halovivax limisalsi TaxID=1453760 RepID=UPI001FFD1976|nr:hydrogen gas-evolving membrane-bound hydrogenase subunit E [Halovivax limisalsi]